MVTLVSYNEVVLQSRVQANEVLYTQEFPSTNRTLMSVDFFYVIFIVN